MRLAAKQNGAALLRRALGFAFLASLALLPAHAIDFGLDLRQFGYKPGPQTHLRDFTGIAFLSDDLLAVAINQAPSVLAIRNLRRVVIVIDLRTRKVVAKADFQLKDYEGSVQAISGQRLAVLTEDSLSVCSSLLLCHAVLPADSPLRPSPAGTMIAVGGNIRTKCVVADAATLKTLGTFPFSIRTSPAPSHVTPEHPGVILQTVVPGDKAFLVSDQRGAAIYWRDGKRSHVDFSARVFGFTLQFVADELFGYRNLEQAKVLIERLDGRPKFQYDLLDRENGDLISCNSGKRFGIVEDGYTFLNRLMNPLDIMHNRPRNFQRFRVFDSLSGAEVSRAEWNPETRLVKPALSPSGKQFARIRANFLEVLPVSGKGFSLWD